MERRIDILDNVFAHFLKGSRVFRNREVLRHDYVPDYLPHREEEILRLGEITAPTLRGSPCSNVFIYGKTGTGKTAVAKFVLNRITQKAKEINSQVRVCFVNCRLAGTEYRILAALCSSINERVPFTGLAVGELFDRFRKSLESQGVILLAALDEIDALVKMRGDTLLYELTRINESLNRSKVSIIGISNDLKFKEFLDPRVLSTLSEEEMVFKPYTAEELQDILMERAKIAFHEGVLSEEALKLCAALAAAEHGDARRALDLLRVAGEVAERRGDTKILEEHVREAQKRIEHDRVYESIKSLPTHSKIVLLSALILSRFDSDHSITGEIYNLYSELCEQLGMSPLTQRRVSELINELDVMGLLNSRVVSLGRYGRTKKISLGIPRKIIIDVLSEDEILKDMLNYKPRFLSSLQ
ncbi:MAG: ORC1-type DNA replication protein [Candidatus Bathyarchaeia archaeon]|nr:ORC1-type DNA replication protein [Candidatus Bathyarchaeota archaeon]